MRLGRTSSVTAVLRRTDEIGARLLVQGPVALEDIDVGGVTTEPAVRAKILTDVRHVSFALNRNSILTAANYVPARTYGVDLTISF